MVYIRTKLVKGDAYLYLVKSVWDSKKSTSKQSIIKYLGKASQVKIDDIPQEYRLLPKIEAFLATNMGKNIAGNKKHVQKIQNQMFEALITGDIDKSVEIYDTHEQTSNLASFYEDILKPTLYEIGKMWDLKKLSIGQEHIASNTASNLVSIINEKKSKLDGRAKIIICSPNGEEHNLGCNVLQSFLQSKGYSVFNMSPSAPSEAILESVKTIEPDIILISITLEDSIKTCKRLVKKILQSHKVPIFVGGQAIENNDSKFDCPIIKNEPLDKILKNIKKTLKN